MAIIKYRIEATVTHTDCDYDKNVIESAWVFEEINGNPWRSGRPRSREEAKEIIKEQGLILVHKCEYGAIYDLPNEPMWERYNGLTRR